MNKIKSIVKKVKNLKIDAFEQGKQNFESNSEYWNKIAQERSEICFKKCGKLEDEPIDFLKVKDSIKSISNKMCGECGCTASYLLRQDEKKCQLKKW